MKKFSVLFSLLVLFFACNKTQIPVFSTDSLIIDCGIISMDDTPLCKFSFANDGKSELEIKKIITSCNLVLASDSTASLIPGEEKELKVYLIPSRKGSFKGNVMLYSNADPIFYFFEIIAEISD